MIRVCHMTSGHNPEDVRIFHKECTPLFEAGYDVTIVEKGESYEKGGIHIIGVGQHKGRLNRMAVFTNKVYKAALKVNADVYHFHDAELLPYGLKLKKKGKKVIYDSHEHIEGAILEKEYIPAFARKIISRIFGRYQRSVCRKLDAVVTVTPSLVDYFKQINKNTYYVANFPLYSDSGTEPQFKTRRLVFAGGISAQWNHHHVINALEKLPGCRYCLCGIAESGYLEKLMGMSGWKQVDYLGRIPHGEVAKELSECYVGLALLTPGENTNWHNGSMGNTKIFEEMMAGLPVVCTDFVLWKEFVERYNCGICVDPSDEDVIVSAVQYLFDHPEEANKMGKNGQRAVKEEFNWAVEEKKLLALYEDILKDGEKTK